MPVNVLIVDDSAVIRGLMAKALAEDPVIAITGSAANGEIAINIAQETKPDIIILDIEMPVMDGLTALPKLLQVSPGSKVIIASTLSLRNAEISLRALSLGATDYLAKPTAKVGGEVQEFYRELLGKIKALAPAGAVSVARPAVAAASAAPVAVVPVAPPKPAATIPTLAVSQTPLTQTRAIAIASSTGGPQALMKVFEDIKGRLRNMPIFITQHMPPTFTTILAEHISKAADRKCVEASEGLVAENGCAYLAPGDYHMVAEKTNDQRIVLHINQNAPENFCRPAADPMIRSLSAIYGNQLLIVVLTGMGHDGMEGAKVAAAKGASVIAQDEASCTVYGMPKAVVDAGLCRAVLPLGNIGRFIVEQIEGK